MYWKIVLYIKYMILTVRYITSYVAHLILTSVYLILVFIFTESPFSFKLLLLGGIALFQTLCLELIWVKPYPPNICNDPGIMFVFW